MPKGKWIYIPWSCRCRKKGKTMQAKSILRDCLPRRGRIFTWEDDCVLFHERGTTSLSNWPWNHTFGHYRIRHTYLFISNKKLGKKYGMEHEIRSGVVSKNTQSYPIGPIWTQINVLLYPSCLWISITTSPSPKQEHMVPQEGAGRGAEAASLHPLCRHKMQTVWADTSRGKTSTIVQQLVLSKHCLLWGVGNAS